MDAKAIAEQPRLGPHRAQMERNLGDVLSAPVSVKATTNDGLGAIGRGEGIASLRSRCSTSREGAPVGRSLPNSQPAS